MKYSWSKFTMLTELADSTIITNLKFFDIIKVKNEGRIHSSFVLKDTSLLTDKDIEFLINSNFLVKDGTDEIGECEFIRNRSVFSDSILDITILPTDSCNFRCVYCYEAASNQHLSEENEEAIIKFIKKNAHKYKQIRLAWFGGEPLVRKDQVVRMTKAINDICRDKGILFSARMTTNAYELDLETFNELVKNRLLAYQICIDGNRESHNRQRPHATNDDSYDKIIQNIKEIARKAKSNTFLISLRTNITSETEDYIEEYLHEIYDIIGDDKRFEIVFQGVRNWGGTRISKNNVVLVDEESKLYEKWYTKAAQIGLNSAENMDLSIYSPMCAANFVAGYVIYPDCSVHKCTLAYFSDKARNEGCIGKIDNKGNLSVDYSKVMKWMIHNSHNEKCVNCALYCVCKGGACPYSSNIIGNPINKSNHCSELYSLVMSKIRCLFLKNMIEEYSEDLR